MKMTSIWKQAVAVVAICACYTSTANATIIIDEFNEPAAGQFATDTTNSGAVAGGGAAFGVIGGVRDLVANKTGGVVATGNSVRVGANLGGSNLGEFSLLGNTTLGTGSFIYDGVFGGAGVGFGLNSEDLSSASQFVINGLSITTNGAGLIAPTLTVIVHYGASGSSTFTTGAVTAGDYTIGFTKFLGVNWTDITGLGFTFNGTLPANQGVDVAFDSIVATTPEPASIGLLLTAGAMMGLGRVLRRRKTA